MARWMQRLRERVGARFTAAIPGAAGTIAATLLTGMSGVIPEPDHQAFRDSSLAHLLATAGLPAYRHRHGLDDVSHPGDPGG